MRKKSIRFRTTAIFFLVSTFFFAVILGALYSNALTQTKARATEETLKNLEYLGVYLSTNLEGITSAMHTVTQNSTVFFEDREAIAAHMKTYENLTKNFGVKLVIEDDRALYIQSEKWLYDVAADLSRYRELSRSNRMVITEPYYSSLLAYRAVGVIRSIFDHSTGAERLVVGEMNTKNLFSSLVAKLDRTETLVVLSPSGQTVYVDPGSGLMQKTANEKGLLEITGALRGALMALSPGVHEVRMDGKDFVVCMLTHEQGWNMYALMDAAGFYSDIFQMLRTYLLMAPIAIVALTAASLLFGAWVLRPIRALANQMDALAADVWEDDSTPGRQDEIERLLLSFERMLARIRRAGEERSDMEKQRYEMEYQVLQSQIQPHFLFNIHVCVDALLVGGQIAQAREMLAGMDTLLRASIGSEALIPLGEELALSRHYLELNQMRLGDIFDARICCPESLKDVPVPKLLIQPILENALYHGFVNIDHRGEIDLVVEEIDEELIHILIVDNGRGISKERLAAIEHEDTEPLTGKHGMVSIALSNVRRRIQGFYGEGCGLFISSREGIGAEVELVIKKCINR